jgi:CRISPR-associated protein Csb2
MCAGAMQLLSVGAERFPKPKVAVLDYVSGTDDRLTAHLLVHFAVGVEGPLLLGRHSHQGGGLFLAKS